MVRINSRKLRALLDERHMTALDLWRESQLSWTTVGELLNDNSTSRLWTIAEVARALKVKVSEITEDDDDTD